MANEVSVEVDDYLNLECRYCGEKLSDEYDESSIPIANHYEYHMFCCQPTSKLRHPFYDPWIDHIRAADNTQGASFTEFMNKPEIAASYSEEEAKRYIQDIYDRGYIYYTRNMNTWKFAHHWKADNYGGVPVCLGCYGWIRHDGKGEPEQQPMFHQMFCHHRSYTGEKTIDSFIDMMQNNMDTYPKGVAVADFCGHGNGGEYEEKDVQSMADSLERQGFIKGEWDETSDQYYYVMAPVVMNHHRTNEAHV